MTLVSNISRQIIFVFSFRATLEFANSVCISLFSSFTEASFDVVCVCVSVFAFYILNDNLVIFFLFLA